MNLRWSISLLNHQIVVLQEMNSPAFDVVGEANGEERSWQEDRRQVWGTKPLVAKEAYVTVDAAHSGVDVRQLIRES